MTDYSDDEVLDPRVQVELEKLNTFTEEINHLEIEYDEGNAKFRQTLSESSQILKQLLQRYGNHVEKARPYYNAKKLAQQAHLETERAAIQYQHANSIHQAAKETIMLAEQRFLSEDKRDFDNAWQEMLNQATTKVMEAEAIRAQSKKEHQMKTAAFTAAEKALARQERKLKKAILKSRPYFEQQESFETSLEMQKQRVQSLQTTISQTKQRYTQTLRNLERISEEVHLQRKQRRLAPMCPREPGVGAEKEPESLVIDLDKICLSRAASFSDLSEEASDPEDDQEETSIPNYSKLEFSNRPDEIKPNGAKLKIFQDNESVNPENSTREPIEGANSKQSNKDPVYKLHSDDHPSIISTEVLESNKNKDLIVNLSFKPDDLSNQLNTNNSLAEDYESDEFESIRL